MQGNNKIPPIQTGFEEHDQNEENQKLYEKLKSKFKDTPLLSPPRKHSGSKSCINYFF